jgi:hypothetical protein
VKALHVRVAAWIGALAALAAVFAAWLDPHFVFGLASRVWACF